MSRCIAARSLGMPATITRSAAPCVEQRGGDLGDRLPRGALAHAHQHDAVADRHDVAALEGGQAPVLLGVAPPHRRADEVGVELVDRLYSRVSSCRAGQYSGFRVSAAVEPARGVAGVERVRQRRHQVLADAGRAPGQGDVAACGSRRAGRRWPARRSGTRPARAASSDSRKARVSSTSPRPTSLATILRSSSHAFASGIVHRLGEQVVQLDDLDAALAQLVHEVGVVALGVLHPHHVVEEQVVAVGRGQPAVRQAGRADQRPCAACRPRSGRRRRLAAVSLS